MTKVPGLTGATAALCLFAFDGSALAQTSVYRTVEAAPGKPIRVRVVTNLKKDCTVGPMAEVKVVTTPKNGDLVIKNTKMKTPANYRCPNIETQVQYIFYQSKPKFTGTDEVGLQLKDADGNLQSVNVKVSVVEKPTAPPKKEEGIDL